VLLILFFINKGLFSEKIKTFLLAGLVASFTMNLNASDEGSKIITSSELLSPILNAASEIVKTSHTVEEWLSLSTVVSGLFLKSKTQKELSELSHMNEEAFFLEYRRDYFKLEAVKKLDPVVANKKVRTYVKACRLDPNVSSQKIVHQFVMNSKCKIRNAHGVQVYFKRKCLKEKEPDYPHDVKRMRLEK
jgi:hypothetical protein